jgi:hypothetical protein
VLPTSGWNLSDRCGCDQLHRFAAQPQYLLFVDLSYACVLRTASLSIASAALQGENSMRALQQQLRGDGWLVGVVPTRLPASVTWGEG